MPRKPATPSPKPPPPPKPWDQQPGEKDVWYARFIAYRNMGPKRTIEGAWRDSHHIAHSTRRWDGKLGTFVSGGKRPGRHWYAVQVRWRWKERAIAWDEEQRSKAERLARRTMLKVTDDSWDIYEQGLAKLRQFIAMPLTRVETTHEEKDADGTRIVRHITVQPLQGVTMASLASFLSAVMQVGRQAAGVEDVERLTSVTTEQIEQMDANELRALHDMLLPTIERARRTTQVQ